MLKKLAVASCVAGVLSLGVGAVASAAPASGSASTGAGTQSHHLTCADAPKILARIQTVDAKVAARLPKLQAAESKATAAGKTKLAGRIQDRINRLDQVQAKTAAISAKVAAKCPAPAGGTTS